MPQRRGFGDAPQLARYDPRSVLLDLRIIASDDLLHAIRAVGIAERDSSGIGTYDANGNMSEDTLTGL